MTLRTRLSASPVASADRSLLPRAVRHRPEPLIPPADKPNARSLAARRTVINYAARTMHPTPLQVVLYALTLPGGDPRDDLAACQGYADAQHLAVTDRIVDDTQDRTGADDPSLRRGYSRMLHALADPTTPVHGVVAVSRTAITTNNRLYEQQLTTLNTYEAGLWLLRAETAI
jgi:hypothetical protein